MGTPVATCEMGAGGAPGKSSGDPVPTMAFPPAPKTTFPMPDVDVAPPDGIPT